MAGGAGPDKGISPIYTVNPQLKEFMEVKGALIMRIKEGFFNDLFMMLEQAPNKEMTAYEVAARNQEKLQVLGPVIERVQNEKLGPDIKRIFRIMERKRLLPPLPKSLVGVPLGIEYVGILAMAQKAAATAGMERFAQVAGGLQAANPSVADTWDKDEFLREYADNLFISKRIMNSEDKVMAIRAQKQQQQQQAQAAAGAQAAVEGAQTLSQTSVGGGQNALEMMLHGPQGAGAGTPGGGTQGQG
jgi:hypothetical protein